MNWATKNKMTVNLPKTVKIVFHRLNVCEKLPLKMTNVGGVNAAKLLGVYLRHDVNFSQHVDAIAATCRFYLLAQLKKQGLGISSFDTLFKAIVLNKILHAPTVYYGYLTQEQQGVLQRELQVEASLPITTIWMC